MVVIIHQLFPILFITLDSVYSLTYECSANRIDSGIPPVCQSLCKDCVKSCHSQNWSEWNFTSSCDTFEPGNCECKNSSSPEMVKKAAKNLRRFGNRNVQRLTCSNTQPTTGNVDCDPGCAFCARTCNGFGQTTWQGTCRVDNNQYCPSVSTRCNCNNLPPNTVVPVPVVPVPVVNGFFPGPFVPGPFVPVPPFGGRK